MTTIIKPGERYRGMCGECGCEFETSRSGLYNIPTRKISNCPECGYSVNVELVKVETKPTPP